MQNEIWRFVWTRKMKRDKKNISIETIRRYRANEMTPEERNAFERELQKDPFLAEALEGLEQIPTEEMLKSVNEISNRISTGRSKRNFGWIAAAASVLILVSFSIFWMQIRNEQPIPKMTESKKTETKTVESLPEDNEHLELQESPVEEEVVNTEPVATPEPAPLKARESKSLTVPVPLKENKKNDVTPVKEETKTLASTTEAQRTEEDTDQTLHFITTAEVPKTVNNKLNVTFSDQLPTSTPMYRGRIISADDKEPLPGVTIVENGTKAGTVTDLNGNFILPVTNDNATFTASFVGMEKKEFKLDANSSETIEMQPDNQALSEVVVVGYATQNKKQLTGSTVKVSTDQEEGNSEAEPTGGFKAYQEYLNSESILPDDYQKDKVIVKLRFQLNKNGEIESIENLNDTEETLFTKAKQIIEDGPKWNPEQFNNKKVDSIVRLRIVFRKKE